MFAQQVEQEVDEQLTNYAANGGWKCCLPLRNVRAEVEVQVWAEANKIK